MQPADAPPCVEGTTALTRAKLEGDKLVDAKEIFEAKAWNDAPGHFGARIAFDGQGHLFMSVGDKMAGLFPRRPDGAMDPNLEGHPAQKLDNHQGKILRLNDDGTVPQDNPFVGRAGAAAGNLELWATAIRRASCFDRATGTLWETEHGPQGGDELNVIEKGKNYGWPVIGYGANYTLGTEIHASRNKEGMEQPKAFFVPSIGISGLMMYTGDKFPNWKGNAVHRRHGRQLPAARALLGQRQRRRRIASRCCRASTASATCARARTASSTSPPTIRPRSAEQHRSARAEQANSPDASREKLVSQSLRSPHSRRAQRHRLDAQSACDRACLTGYVDSYFAALVRERREQAAAGRAGAHHRERRREETRRHVLGGAAEAVYRFDIVNTERGDTGTQTVIRNADGSKTMHMVRLKVLNGAITEIETIKSQSGRGRPALGSRSPDRGVAGSARYRFARPSAIRTTT